MSNFDLTHNQIRDWLIAELEKRGVPSGWVKWILVWKSTGKVSFFMSDRYRTFDLGDPDLFDRAYEFYCG